MIREEWISIQSKGSIAAPTLTGYRPPPSRLCSSKNSFIYVDKSSSQPHPLKVRRSLSLTSMTFTDSESYFSVTVFFLQRLVKGRIRGQCSLPLGTQLRVLIYSRISKFSPFFFPFFCLLFLFYSILKFFVFSPFFVLLPLVKCLSRPC